MRSLAFFAFTSIQLTDRWADMLVTVNQIDIKAKNAKERIYSASDLTEQVEYLERSFFTVIWNTSKAVANLVLKKDKQLFIFPLNKIIVESTQLKIEES